MSRASSRGAFTILAIYSLMNGATLHVMPRLFYEAGLAVGVVLTCLIGVLSWYTCGLIVQIGAYSTEYDDFVSTQHARVHTAHPGCLRPRARFLTGCLWLPVGLRWGVLRGRLEQTLRRRARSVRRSHRLDRHDVRRLPVVPLHHRGDVSAHAIRGTAARGSSAESYWLTARSALVCSFEQDRRDAGRTRHLRAPRRPLVVQPLVLGLRHLVVALHALLPAAAPPDQDLRRRRALLPRRRRHNGRASKMMNCVSKTMNIV